MVSAPELMKQALAAGSAGDLTRLGAAAHALAGGSSMLGARKLSATCHEVEDHAESGDVGSARAALAIAEQDLESLTRRFEEMTMKRAA